MFIKNLKKIFILKKIISPLRNCLKETIKYVKKCTYKDVRHSLNEKLEILRIAHMH